MAKNKNGDIRFHIKGKSHEYPEGVIRVVHMPVEGKPKSKSIALGSSYTDEQAFEIVNEWAKEKEQETGAKLHAETLENLLARINKATEKPRRVSRVSTSQATETEKHFLYESKLKSKLLSMAEKHGAERLIKTLTSGIEALQEYQAQELKFAEDKSRAAKSIAKAMYKAYQDTGVDLQDSITDGEVLKEYRLLAVKGAK